MLLIRREMPWGELVDKVDSLVGEEGVTQAGGTEVVADIGLGLGQPTRGKRRVTRWLMA